MNDIEKQLAQNANNKTFEYKEAYWDSALATLKVAEAAKRRKGFFWIFFALLLVGCIGVYFAINLTNNSNEVANYIPRDHKLNAHIEIVSTNSVSNSSITTNNNSGTDKNNNSNSIKPKAKTNNNNTNLDKTVTNNSKNLANSSNTGNKTVITTSNNNTTPVTNTQPNKNTQPILNKPNNNNGLANNGDMIANNNQTNNNVNSQFTNNVINNNTAIKTSNKKDKSVLGNLFSIELDANTGKDELALYTGEEEDFKIISKEEKSRKLSFVINVGALASKNFNESSINFDFPYLGGELYYQINNKFNASIGGAWYKRSGIGYVNNYTSTEYGFGKKETTTVVSFDKIYFAEIPLKINYSLTRNHLIGLGGTYSFILGGENRIFSNQTEYGANGTSFSENENEEKIPGFENAYSKSSKAIFVSYEYRKNRFGAELRYHYGLNDITNDNIFNKTQIDRNSRFLFTLKYLLFK